MRSTDYIKAKLFDVAYHESNGKCGIYGEIVARCLANRVRRHMGTWSEVLMNYIKYRANAPDAISDMPNLWDPQTQKLMQVMDDVYDNAGEDPSNGGLYWIFTEKGVNDWFRTFVINNQEYAVTAMQNSMKVYGEKIIIGKQYDPRIASDLNRNPW